MRDLKLVLLFALPVIAVVVGVFLYNLSGEPTSEPVEEEDPGRLGDDELKRQQNKPVPPVKPVAPHHRGMLPEEGPAPARVLDEEAPLDPERLKALLAEEGPLKWKDIELLLAHGAPLEEPEELASLLVGVLREDPTDGIWIHKLLPMLVAREEGLRAQVVDELLGVAREIDDHWARSAAFAAVGSIAGIDALPFLAQFARTLENENSAKAAIQAMGNIGARNPSEAAPELTRLLTERVGTNLEGRILQAMALVASPIMVNNLAALVAEGGSKELRLAGVRALGMMRTPDAVNPLKDLLRKEVEPDLANAVILSLGSLGTGPAVEELLRVRKEGGELGRRAGMAVGSAKGRGAVDPILREIDGITEEPMKVRWVRALGESGSEQPVNKLREIMRSGNETEGVRGAAMEALAKLRDGDSVVAIAEALDAAPRGDVNLKYSALRAIEKLLQVPSTMDAMNKNVVPVLEKIVGGGEKDYAYYRAQKILNMLGRGFKPKPKPK